MFEKLIKSIYENFEVNKKINLSELYDFLFKYFDMEGGLEQEELLYLLIYRLAAHKTDRIMDAEHEYFTADWFRLLTKEELKNLHHD